MEQRNEQRRVTLSGLDRWLRSRPWVVDTLFAVALAVAVGPASVPLLWEAPWPVAARIGVLAPLVLAHAAVAARRTAPLAAYGVACAAMLVLVAAPDITNQDQPVPPILLPSALVFFVLLYAVSAYGGTAHAPGPWPIAALGVALAGAAMTTVRLWAVTGPQPTWRLFLPAALFAAVLAPWSLGRFRAVRTAYVDALEERAIRAEERRAERAEQAATAERARIAREMHDVVAHSLAVIVRQADGGRFAAAKEPGQAVAALAAIATTGRQALTDMRAVLGVLGQGGDSDLAPQPALDDVPALVDRVRAAGTPVSLTTTGTARSLDRAASLAAYRVVQEALTNVVRHARTGAAATVRLDWCEDGLAIAVTDDGGSTPGDSVPDGSVPGGSPAGRGIVGMRERVAVVGGRVSAGPRGDGFAVVAHLPVTGAAT